MKIVLKHTVLTIIALSALIGTLNSMEPSKNSSAIINPDNLFIAADTPIQALTILLVRHHLPLEIVHHIARFIGPRLKHLFKGDSFISFITAAEHGSIAQIQLGLLRGQDPREDMIARMYNSPANIFILVHEGLLPFEGKTGQRSRIILALLKRGLRFVDTQTNTLSNPRFLKALGFCQST